MSERVANNASKTGENAAETATGTIPPRSVHSPFKRDFGAQRYQGPAKAGLPSGIDSIRLLHQTVGNQAVGRLILQSKVKSQESGGIQAKLSINKPDDIYEQEADRVADTVMRMTEKEGGSTSGISQSAIRNPKSAIQRKPG